MDKKSALGEAQGMFYSLIKSQPNMIQLKSSGVGSGKELAGICKEFIDEYASYLEKRTP